MKSKFGLLSVAFVAASAFFGPADASATEFSGWYGRVGYGRLRVKELRACVDDYSGMLRVAFKVPGAASYMKYRGVNVSAKLFGNALCDDHLGDDGWYTGWAKGGGYYGYGAYAQGLYSGYGKFADEDIVYVDGLHTYNEYAHWEPGNWFYAEFDLLAHEKEICHYGYMEDIYINRAHVFINGWRYSLGYYDLELCGDTWYDDWYDDWYEGWDD